ncbi:hypothetical protein [Lactiplantibacillus fabifermentans]|uniref:Uncharacterized protein n=2 Tax=Lactiplantibacillus fabifermentans TaxID=483011 RepID=A0A0R2P185_9LACO|nr:hypothetical protein [Lactiplantibacillus fabifermentans]ETY75068.1 hypothetical protein LFAB_03970 [Lactiplantibacillus fabifermentans T30PCM01]KRO29475.1 hypothetical protein DY78_GL000019 [Lactiplantibacillus fabifermentans DSM 21115]
MDWYVWFNIIGLMVTVALAMRTHYVRRTMFLAVQATNQTMTPRQIRRSWRFFDRAEIAQSQTLRRLDFWGDRGTNLATVGLALTLLKWTGVMLLSWHAQFWIAVSALLVLLGTSLKLIFSWQVQRRLLAAHATSNPQQPLAPGATTETLAHQYLNYRQITSWCLGVVVSVGFVMNATGWLAPDYTALRFYGTWWNYFKFRYHWQTPGSHSMQNIQLPGVTKVAITAPRPQFKLQVVNNKCAFYGTMKNS